MHIGFNIVVIIALNASELHRFSIISYIFVVVITSLNIIVLYCIIECILFIRCLSNCLLFSLSSRCSFSTSSYVHYLK
jgi:hypothetical protein